MEQVLCLNETFLVSFIVDTGSTIKYTYMRPSI